MKQNMKLKLGEMSMGTALEYLTVSNPHVLLTGVSGYGKSWELRLMVLQVPEQKGRAIILDFSGDFQKPYPKQGWDPKRAEVIDVRSGKYRMNPFRKKEGESVDDVVDRVMEMISSGLRLTPSQWAYVADIIAEGMANGTIDSMAALVQAIKEDAENYDVAARLLPKIRSLGRLIPCGDQEIDWKADEPGITIVDLSKIKDRTARLILTEMMLSDICDLRMNGEPSDEVNPLVVLVDECQHLCFRESDQEVRILREGRKYGVGGWFATQWIHDRTAMAALGQAGLHLYFRPAEDDLHKTAMKLANGDRKRIVECEKRLSRLKVGQFLYRNGSRLVVSSPPQK